MIEYEGMISIEEINKDGSEIDEIDVTYHRIILTR